MTLSKPRKPVVSYRLKDGDAPVLAVIPVRVLRFPSSIKRLCQFLVTGEKRGRVDYLIRSPYPANRDAAVCGLVNRPVPMFALLPV